MARMNVLADVVKGLKANIHAVDNLSPVSRVAVYVKAGSRYEPDAVPGVSHFLRASAGLTTRDSSAWGITRHLERAGAHLRVTSDREYIVYRVDCLRDKLAYILGFIDDTIHRPEFRSWEIHDMVLGRLKEDLARYKQNQKLMANEALHKVAYRGGLAHSVYIPEHQIDKIKRTELLEYVDNNYVLERMSFMGLGTDEAELRNIIEGTFELKESVYKGVSGTTRYVGGEARIQAGFPNTMVNIVVQGSPVLDLKTCAALEVIGQIIGAEADGSLKYSYGPESSLSAIIRALSPEFRTSLININHTDTGLFGYSIVGPNNDNLREAVRVASRYVRKTMSSITDAQLETAKKAAKAKAIIRSEDQETVFDTVARLHASGIVGQSPISHLDKLTLKDIQTTVGNLLKSKPTMVTVGNPRFVPYIDELD